MKAVILAGGLGTRMREETEFKPKPMVEIGGKPVLWHIMKILSSQGISEFVILGGYRVEYIKQYFLNLTANLYNFTVQGSSIEIHSKTDQAERLWRVTVVDTGLETLTAGRLMAAREFIGEEDFICTYGDGLADINLNQLLSRHRDSGRIATMTVFQPENRFGVVEFSEDFAVNSFKEKPQMTDWINIGYFVFSRGIWDFLLRDEPLEEAPLRALSERKELSANTHDGFWMPMDTFREYSHLNSLWSAGKAPWMVWQE